MYRIKILYQILLFIILSKYSIANGDNETFTANTSQSSNIYPRIVNGTKAKMGQFPYMVSLRRSRSMNLFCGGSLINEKWVLTAAHCLFQNDNLIPESSIVVVGGELQLYPETYKRQMRSVLMRTPIPTYNHDTIQNDIALLLLKNPFQINSYVKLIKWPLIMPRPGTKCIAAGWGYLYEGSNIVSNDLMYVQLPVIAESVCKKYMANSIDIGPGLFCAGYETGGRDSCQGDSGGPLVCNNSLIGIVSTGVGCARLNFLGIYTKVNYYSSWINLMIASGSSNAIYNMTTYPGALGENNNAASKFHRTIYSNNLINFNINCLIIFLSSLLSYI